MIDLYPIWLMGLPAVVLIPAALLCVFKRDGYALRREDFLFLVSASLLGLIPMIGFIFGLCAVVYMGFIGLEAFYSALLTKGWFDGIIDRLNKIMKMGDDHV